ncbi:hypothetical protein TNCV_4439531 [Trichonephila clavipes]|nr:hypothetical protein TNCV_4439531 [Trichonephila clavipes]
MHCSSMNSDSAYAMIFDHYGSEESQEIVIKLAISLNHATTIVLVPWFGQEYLPLPELINKGFLPLQGKQLFIECNPMLL